VQSAKVKITLSLEKKAGQGFSFSTNLSLEKKALPKKLVFLVKVFAKQKSFL